jgi:glycosyltransferase involved in cell wall biosynthesis
MSPATLDAVRRRLCLESNNVCVYSGGMYREKRLQFLLDACEAIRNRVPDFQMVFMGAGPDSRIVKEAAARFSWIKYVGPTFGDEKVALFGLAKLHLMPGLVGLGVLDSFALATPLVTTAVTYHSPEIEYLTPDRGLIVQQTEDAVAYAEAVVSLLRDDAKRDLMQRACIAASYIYTVEGMADNFSAGVVHALS